MPAMVLFLTAGIVIATIVGAAYAANEPAFFAAEAAQVVFCCFSRA